MRIKFGALMLMLTATLFLFLANIPKISSAEMPRVYVNPVINYALPGEELTITVNVADVDNLYSWQANMSFNPSVLQYVNVTEGDFLKDQPEGTYFAKNTGRASAGIIQFGSTTWGQYPGVSGSGILATVKFNVTTTGESPLEFNQNRTFLMIAYPPPPPPGKDVIDLIDSVKEDGLFTNLVTPPVARFNVSTKTPAINQIVTFNASESSAGSQLQIVSYNWTFGDGTNGTGVTTQHAYAQGGNYTVTLTVFDNATASDLVRTIFNTTATEMPSVWYELYSSAQETLSITFAIDIAVIDIQVSNEEVTVGDVITIDVTVANRGSESSSFSVTASYDTTLIGAKEAVTDLSPGSNATRTFQWDTTGLPEGDFTEGQAIYQVVAEAVDVVGDGNLGNNKLIYTNPIIVNSGVSFSIPITWIAGIVVVIVVLGVGVFWYLRRKGASPQA